MNLFRLAFLNATRNKTRSLLTAGIIVGGTALFIISLSWLDGVFNQVISVSAESLGHVRIVTPEYAARAALFPQDENIDDVAPVLAAVRSHPGVQAAYPLIETGATLTVGEEIGDIFGAVIGAPEEYFLERADVDAQLTDGRWLEEGKDEVVLGYKLAKRTGATVGQEVVLLGATQDGSMSPVKGTIVGVVRGGGAVDRRVFMDFAKAQYMLDAEGGAMKVLAYASDYDEANDVAASLAGEPALAGLDVADWTTIPPWNQSIGMMGAIRYVIMFMVAFLAGLGVWNTMMMSVLERTHEIGVLRAMGMTRPGAVLLFMLEGIAIAILGGVVGVIAGVLPTLYMETQGFVYPQSIMEKVPFALPDTLYADLTMEIVALAFVTALITALVGTFLPALRAATIQPDTAMRRN